MYQFKETSRVIDGIRYSVRLEEGEMAYHVRLENDGVTTVHYTQSKGKDTCTCHYNGTCMPGEVMSTASDLYKQLSTKLRAI